MDIQPLNSEQVSDIVLLIFTNCHSFKKRVVVSRQHFLWLLIVLCQLHVQAVEYTMDDQPIILNKCELVVNLYTRVSGR